MYSRAGDRPDHLAKKAKRFAVALASRPGLDQR
jgi:hypothetical protein